MYSALSYPSQEAIRYRSKNTTVLDIESSFLETLRYAAVFNRIAEQHQNTSCDPSQLSYQIAYDYFRFSLTHGCIVWRAPYKNDVSQTRQPAGQVTHIVSSPLGLGLKAESAG